MPKTDKTLKIEAILTKYHSQVADGVRQPLVGFHRNLARRYGVSKGRISNIARGLGLTGRKPGAKKKARSAR